MTVHQLLRLFVILVVTFSSIGCEEDADSFFTGRPSKMAMVHNQIISGGPAEIEELLKIPSKFPKAEAHHIASWQESMISWWLNSEKREIMKVVFKNMTLEETQSIKIWLSVRDIHLGRQKNLILDEIVAVFGAIRGEYYL